MMLIGRGLRLLLPQDRGKEKSVNVPQLPGGVAHLACAQKEAIRTDPRR